MKFDIRVKFPKPSFENCEFEYVMSLLCIFHGRRVKKGSAEAAACNRPIIRPLQIYVYIYFMYLGVQQLLISPARERCCFIPLL